MHSCWLFCPNVECFWFKQVECEESQCVVHFYLILMSFDFNVLLFISRLHSMGEVTHSVRFEGLKNVGSGIWRVTILWKVGFFYQKKYEVGFNGLKKCGKLDILSKKRCGKWDFRTPVSPPPSVIHVTSHGWFCCSMFSHLFWRRSRLGWVPPNAAAIY